MKHSIRDENVKHFEELLLFPDYASSGLWCSCGLGIGNPQDGIPLPYQIIELVDLWNSYWEAMDEDAKETGINEYAEKQIINTGRILCEMISDIIPCEFLEERSTLKRYK